MGAPTDGRIGIWMTSALVVGTMIGAGIFMLPVALAPLGANAVARMDPQQRRRACHRLLARPPFPARRRRDPGQYRAAIGAQRRLPRGLVASGSRTGSAQAAVAIAGASALSWISPAFAGPGFVIAVAIASVVALHRGQRLRRARVGRGLDRDRRDQAAAARRRDPDLRPARHRSAPLTSRWRRCRSTLGNIATATALTFFALTGFENATTPVDKVRDPARTIPRAIIGGTLFVAIVYLLASTGVQLILPAAMVAASPAPFADALAAQWGGGVASLAALAIAVAAFGCLNALILGTGELGYALGLRRDLPAVMARTWRGNTPVGAQIAGSVLSVLLILANSNRASASLFTFIILLSTASVLVVYLAGALSAWRLSASARGPGGRSSSPCSSSCSPFTGRAPRPACGASSCWRSASPSGRSCTGSARRARSRRRSSNRVASFFRSSRAAAENRRTLRVRRHASPGGITKESAGPSG